VTPSWGFKLMLDFVLDHRVLGLKGIIINRTDGIKAQKVQRK
jgi:hypothetical protein